MVAQQQQPRVDRARHGGGETARARHEVEALAAQVLDRGAGRRRALAHQHDRGAGLRRGDEEAGHVAARPVQMRLDDVQHERAGDRGVEGVAAALEHGLGAGGGEPVRRGGHAEGAGERRPRRERGRGVNVIAGGARRAGVGPRSRAIQASTSSAVRGMPADRLTGPSAVIRMSSSMRTPMPRYSSGTVRSSIWKYSPGSIVKTMPGSSSAVVVHLAARLRAVVHVDAEVVARAVHHVAAVLAARVGVERLLGGHRQQAPLRRRGGR